MGEASNNAATGGWRIALAGAFTHPPAPPSDRGRWLAGRAWTNQQRGGEGGGGGGSGGGQREVRSLTMLGLYNTVEAVCVCRCLDD